MQVKREDALKLFEELPGFPTARKWDDAMMAQRLGKLSTLLSEDVECESEECQELLDDIKKASNAGEEIEVMSENGTAVKAGKKAKKSKEAPESNGEAKGKKDKTTKTRREAAAKDKYGYREGTQAAQINTAIGKKPKTPKEISEECGLPEKRVYGHLFHMKRKGLVESTDKGWKAKSE